MQSELAQDKTFQRAVVLIRDISLAPRKDPTVELSSEVMPTRLLPYLRERIVRLWKEGENISSIMTILRAEGGETTRATVRKWIYRWEERRGLEDDHRSGRPSKITLDMAVFLEQQLEEDDELTSVELQRLVTRRFDVKLTSATIRRYLRIALQWSVVRTRYGPMISDQNKVKRVAFAKMCLDTKDEFDNVIWTDESSVQLRRHSHIMRVKVGKERILKPAAKHTVKVHVWAGISKMGATKICIFDQIMDAHLYVKILEDFLLPFLEDSLQGRQYRFMQDNDPKHTSRLAKNFYKERGINWWPTPASSADFNPIERVWRELKYFIARQVKPLTKKELVDGICLFWGQRMTVAKCKKYIDHTHVVLPKILEAEGGIPGE